MTLAHILVFIPMAWIAGRFIAAGWRMVFLLAASLAAIFWLQPALPVRNLDFWLPVVSIGLVVLTWCSAQPLRDRASVAQAEAGQEKPNSRGEGFSFRRFSNPDLTALLVIAGAVIAIALTRYTGSLCCLTATRPPALGQVLLAVGVLVFLGMLFLRRIRNRRLLSNLMILVILSLFILLKTPALAERSSAWLRTLTGQPIALAAASDLAWLGFSFVAFRLLHVLRDFQTGKLPGYSLGEMTSYALFFPTYTAGPIDRVQRWIGELHGQGLQKQDLHKQGAVGRDELQAGGWRIFIGIFKKFVLADALALIALSAQNAVQIQTTGWAWLILYAYALRIYLDFSGYTDIAIGLGRLAGFRLPENFANPYMKTNLTAFWNSWHITLAQWFRAYYFNPLTRALRSPSTNRAPVPTWGIILIGQVTTMLMIGLWHGITINFAIWGLWHGIGLFVHNRWSEYTRQRAEILNQNKAFERLANAGGWLVTFNFVTLGWVWFSLPDPQMAVSFFEKLAGY